jgi:hypothetical protein
MSTHTAHEKRVRRLADREGYRLKKLRNGCGYWLIDNSMNIPMLGEVDVHNDQVGYVLEVVEDWLTGEPETG